MMKIEVGNYYGHMITVERGTDGKVLPWKAIHNINAIDHATISTIEVEVDPWTNLPILPANVKDGYYR